MSNDDFADVRDIVQGFGAGVLSGEGVDFHNRVNGKLSQEGDGFSYQIRCDKCGRTLLVGVTWGEMIIMGKGAIPSNEWRHDAGSGCFVPAVGCTHCGDHIRLGITPDECNRNLNAGIAARKISHEDIQHFLAKLAPRR